MLLPKNEQQSLFLWHSVNILQKSIFEIITYIEQSTIF